jgi:hypothetical protein
VISAGLTNVSLTGTTLSFSVSLAGKESVFTAEIAGGEIRLRSVVNAGGNAVHHTRCLALLLRTRGENLCSNTARLRLEGNLHLGVTARHRGSDSIGERPTTWYYP